MYSAYTSTHNRNDDNDHDSSDQQQLRKFLTTRSHDVSEKTKVNLRLRAQYGLIPQHIVNIFPKSNVLEIGPGISTSTRSLRSAKSVSIVEPDPDALSLAFNLYFTKSTDVYCLERLNKNLSKLHESYEATAQRLNLDCSWLYKINVGDPWINDNVTLYLTTLQNLPHSCDGYFNIAIYRHYNICEEEEAFFKRLHELLAKDGIAIFEFYEDEGNFHTPKIIQSYSKYFNVDEKIIDEKGSHELIDFNHQVIDYTLGLEQPIDYTLFNEAKTIHTPNCIRFIQLKKI